MTTSALPIYFELVAQIVTLLSLIRQAYRLITTRQFWLGWNCVYRRRVQTSLNVGSCRFLKLTHDYSSHGNVCLINLFINKKKTGGNKTIAIVSVLLCFRVGKSAPTFFQSIYRCTENTKSKQDIFQITKSSFNLKTWMITVEGANIINSYPTRNFQKYIYE